MRQKLHLITLGVDNLKKSLQFYEQGLGWKKPPTDPDIPKHWYPHINRELT